MHWIFIWWYILKVLVGIDPENKIPANISKLPAGLLPTKG